MSTFLLTSLVRLYYYYTQTMRCSTRMHKPQPHNTVSPIIVYRLENSLYHYTHIFAYYIYRQNLVYHYSQISFCRIITLLYGYSQFHYFTILCAISDTHTQVHHIPSYHYMSDHGIPYNYTTACSPLYSDTSNNMTHRYIQTTKTVYEYTPTLL